MVLRLFARATIDVSWAWRMELGSQQPLEYDGDV